MLLNEVFNQPYKWKSLGSGKWEYSAGFKMEDGATYMIAAYLQDINNKPTWMFNFSRIEEGKSPNYGITNTGNQQQIFATILDILFSFISEKNPNRIIFDAVELNRKKLYIRMIKSLLVDWDVTVNDATILITKKQNN
jgi:hypothetical protein